MPDADTIESLALELAAMPPRARDAILQSLSPAERKMLAERTCGDAPTDETAAADGCSPWLASLIRQARANAAGGEAGHLTGATRQVLVRSADAISGTDRPGTATRGTMKPSLLEAMGGFLSPRRPKP